MPSFFNHASLSARTFFIREQAILECKLTKAPRAERKPILIRDEIVCERFDHSQRQMTSSNGFAEKANRTHNAKTLFASQLPRHGIVQHHLPTAYATERQNPAFAKILLPDGKSLLVGGKGYKKLHIRRTIDRQPSIREDRLESRIACSLSHQFPLDRLGNHRTSIARKKLDNSDPSSLREVTQRASVEYKRVGGTHETYCHRSCSMPWRRGGKSDSP